MTNHEGTGVGYVGTDENNVATYALFMLGHRVMYITVDQSSEDMEMWFRAPGKFHWVKSGMVAKRSPVEPHRAWGLFIAEFVIASLPHLLAAVNDPAYAKIWTDAVKTKNEQFVNGGIADVEAFLKSQPPKS